MCIRYIHMRKEAHTCILCPCTLFFRISRFCVTASRRILVIYPCPCFITKYNDRHNSSILSFASFMVILLFLGVPVRCGICMKAEPKSPTWSVLTSQDLHMCYSSKSIPNPIISCPQMTWKSFVISLPFLPLNFSLSTLTHLREVYFTFQYFNAWSSVSLRSCSDRYPHLTYKLSFNIPCIGKYLA